MMAFANEAAAAVPAIYMLMLSAVGLPVGCHARLISTTVPPRGINNGNMEVYQKQVWNESVFRQQARSAGMGFVVHGAQICGSWCTVKSY